MTCASFAQLSRHLVAFLIFGAKPGNICIAHVVHVLHQIDYAITIERIAKTRLSGNFVAFGDCDLAHVVAEASEFSALQIVPARAPRIHAEMRSSTSVSDPCPTTTLRLRRRRV